MKVNITISLDEEVVKMLRTVENKSRLINSYLINYFSLNKQEVVEE